MTSDHKTIKPKISYYTLNLKISETLSYQNSVNVSMSHTRKCNSKHENQTKNVDEDNLQKTVLSIPEVISEQPDEINTVRINVNKCIEVTAIYVIFFIIGCIVYFGITNVIQNKVHTIQQFIVSSHVLPISPAFDNPKCSQLSVQVIADID